MILEALQHVIIPAPRAVKVLGYVKEAIAIEARHGRCKDAWASHLGHCHQHILTAVKSRHPSSTIMIIGSGALHDVPMTELLTQGFRLILVDIIHLPKIRRKYKSRVQFIEQDVTGYVKNLQEKKILSKIGVDLARADLVISLNILSQLPLNLIKYAGRHHITLPEDFARQVMADHLTLLGPGALIISDLERCYRQGDKLVEQESALPHMYLPEPIDEWDWQIAPKGELDRDISLTHRVGCWLI